MGYITQAEYLGLYPNDINIVTDFKMLEWSARRILDDITTGVDGFCKLKSAFPERCDDVEAVKRSQAMLIHNYYEFLLQDRARENSEAMSGSGGGNGYASGIIEQVSSGTETIKYAVDASASSSTGFLARAKAREEFLRTQADRYLIGTKDKNGVNLLYRGAYPCVRGRCHV